MWAHESYDAAERWRELYPALARELVVLGVYVRVYMRAPAAELDTMRPSPPELAAQVGACTPLPLRSLLDQSATRLPFPFLCALLQILFDMDALNSWAPPGRPLPAEAVATLATLAVAAAELVVVKPSVVPRAAGCLYARVLPALIARDLPMQRSSGSGSAAAGSEGNPFGGAAAPPSNPFAPPAPAALSTPTPPAATATASAADTARHWSESLRASLFLLVVLSTYTPVAEAAAAQLHALHVIARREERARSGTTPSSHVDSGSGAASRSSSSAEAALQASLAALRSAPTEVLALGVMAHALLHTPGARAGTARSGIVAALLAIATAALNPQPDRTRLLAWQALAAACGAVVPSTARPNDSETWEPSSRSACLLLAPPAEESSGADAPAVDGALVAGTPAAYVCAVGWPLLDAASGRGLAALAQAWASPGGAAARWALTIQQPLVVWTDGARADAAAFLKVSSGVRRGCMLIPLVLDARSLCACPLSPQSEWALVDEWLAAHPSDPCSLRSDDVAQRVPRPALSSALCVGGVFVRPFNAAPHSKDVDLPAFAGALSERLTATVATLLSGGVGAPSLASFVADAAECLRAVQSAVEGCTESRSSDAFAGILPVACEAVLTCLHVALPSDLVFGAATALLALARAPGALPALSRQPTAFVLRLMHCLAVATDGRATTTTASDASEARVSVASAVFALLADVVRKNDALARAAVGSALVLHCVRAVLQAAAADASPGLRDVGFAAATAASALVASDSQGAAALALLCDLFDPGWAAAGAWARRPEGVVKFAAETRDASSVSGGRRWDAAAQKALGAFLGSELNAIEAALRIPGSGGLDASLARWDANRIRSLYPQPIDSALLVSTAEE